MRFFLEFAAANNQIAVLDESIEKREPVHGHSDPFCITGLAKRGPPQKLVKGTGKMSFGIDLGIKCRGDNLVETICIWSKLR